MNNWWMRVGEFASFDFCDCFICWGICIFAKFLMLYFLDSFVSLFSLSVSLCMHRFFLKFFLKCNQNCLKNAGNPRDMRRFQVRHFTVRGQGPAGFLECSVLFCARPAIASCNWRKTKHLQGVSLVNALWVFPGKRANSTPTSLKRKTRRISMN